MESLVGFQLFFPEMSLVVTTEGREGLGEVVIDSTV